MKTQLIALMISVALDSKLETNYKNGLKNRKNLERIQKKRAQTSSLTGTNSLVEAMLIKNSQRTWRLSTMLISLDSNRKNRSQECPRKQTPSTMKSRNGATLRRWSV